MANDTGGASIGINANTSVEGAPTVELETTDYGFRFMGIRDVWEKGIYVRGYHFVIPFHQFRPRQAWYRRQPGDPHVSGHMWVLMDDENCMIYSFSYGFHDEPITEDHWLQMEWGHGRGPEQVLPDFRTVGNRDNDWLINREAQKTDNFTGIEGINAQDVAIQESIGAILDRTKDNLSRSDMVIVAARRRFLQAARTVADGGNPPAVDTILSVEAYRKGCA